MPSGSASSMHQPSDNSSRAKRARRSNVQQGSEAGTVSNLRERENQHLSPLAAGMAIFQGYAKSTLHNGMQTAAIALAKSYLAATATSFHKTRKFREMQRNATSVRPPAISD